MSKSKQAKLTAAQTTELLSTLQARFKKYQHRHPGLMWNNVEKLLVNAKGHSLWALYQMENTGGEPDVVTMEGDNGAMVFYDCAAESPKGRRSVCYDRAALEARKEYKPTDTAVDMAAAMGIELLDETQYRALQQFGPFDSKTSSWIATPGAIRKLDGALFGDYRYGQVFIYHNGASSYYAARGFRARLIL